MSDAHSLGTILATDEVIDTIAEIEVQRQEMEREAGRGAASGSALRRLHELLDREQEGLQPHGPDTRRPANIDALTIEIERVKRLGASSSPGSISKNVRPGPRQVSLRSGTRFPP